MIGTTTRTALRAGIPLWLLVVIALIVLPVLSEPFRSANNANSLMASLAPLLLVSAGQAVVVLLGGIDLSVGGIVGLGTVLVATPAVPGWVAAVLALAVGVAAGLVNGLGGLAGVPALVMTLGMSGVLGGIGLLVLAEPGGQVSRGLLAVLTLQAYPVPLAFVVAVAALAVAWTAVSWTRWGRVVLATGHDPVAARRTGLPWRSATLCAYALSGLLSGMAGLAVVARTYSGDSLSGGSLILDSITVVLIAGIALTGGRGSVLTVLPAAAVLGLLQNLIVLSGMDIYYRYIVEAVVLVIAVALYEASGKRPAFLARGG